MSAMEVSGHASLLSEYCIYILGGRTLVKIIQKACAKCRILHKKGVKAAMGPVGASNLDIAPPSIFVKSICVAHLTHTLQSISEQV